MFGPMLRTWRRRRGASQLALALQSGVSQRHVSFLESGRARPEPRDGGPSSPPRSTCRCASATPCCWPQALRPPIAFEMADGGMAFARRIRWRRRPRHREWRRCGKLKPAAEPVRAHPRFLRYNQQRARKSKSERSDRVRHRKAGYGGMQSIGSGADSGSRSRSPEEALCCSIRKPGRGRKIRSAASNSRTPPALHWKVDQLRYSNKGAGRR